jgi:hypothetical protein
MFGVAQSLLKYKVTRFVAASSQHVTVGDVAELAFDLADAFSASIWFRSTYSDAQQKFFSKEDIDPNRGYYVNLDADGGVSWGIGGLTSRIRTVTDTKGLNDGLWHHWAGTYTGNSDASGVLHYLDGALAAHSVTQNNAGTSLLTTIPFSIGSRENGTDLFMSGDLQDLAIFAGVLTAGEVAALHNRACPPDVRDLTIGASLVGYWLLGEHNGDTGAAAGITSGTTVPDLSASGNDGTMVNGPTLVTRL